ncbi:MAG: ribosome-associated translation inhibitor RaiA [Saprospiraceae bacterium]|nr:ribosome-associated translation inhibitor RaiA [Saprospiraceae bacterium]
MTIQVNAPFKISDNLQALIEDKIGKLETFYERIHEAEVFFKDEENSNQQAPKGNTVELRLHVPGNILYAEFSDETYEKALAETVEKMRRQLIKHKEKVNPY